MKISRECIPCLARQAVEIAQEATGDLDKQEEIIKRSLESLSLLDFNETAPEIAFRMHQHAKALTGNNDPYLKLKEEYNQIADTIANRVRQERWIETALNPFDMACRLAISGNIIDFSVGLELGFEDIMKSVENSLKKDIFGTGSKALLQAVQSSKRIMYLADNAGEIIFDKFLLEQLPLERVIYVVKGGAIVNDATMTDAEQTGVADIVNVMDNGHASQGILLEHCSETFKEAFEASDLIISKGQANFETLSHLKDKHIFYLLRAKCESVANEIGCDKMDYVLSDLS